MKPTTVIAIACLSSAAIAAGTSTLLTPRVSARESAPESEATAALERLSEAVTELGRGQRALAADLLRLEQQDQLEPVTSGRTQLGEIDAAVARWMAEHAQEQAEDAASVAVVEVETDEVRLAEALAQLDGDLSDPERQRLWRKLAEEGLTDAIVAAWEERAAREPNNPDMQLALGEIYLNKIFEVGNSPEAGVWATKADRSFDAALALDERHWDARFTKAVSLSFWPPVFGKQGEAIQHFETLVAQQSEGPREARFAQTHLLLGNLYTQMGNKEQALVSWEAGLAQFPEDEDLQKQLAIHTQQ